MFSVLNFLWLRFFLSLAFHSGVNSAPVLLGFDPASLGILGHFDLEYETTVLSANVWNPLFSDTVSSPKNANLSIFLNVIIIKKYLKVSFTVFLHCVY